MIVARHGGATKKTEIEEQGGKGMNKEGAQKKYQNQDSQRTIAADRLPSLSYLIGQVNGVLADSSRLM